MSTWANHAFTIAHADSGAFEGAGLRSFFEYRQLGIDRATDGKFGVVFEYEGQGEHVLRAGSCVLQPSGIIHREVRHSDDMELIEITSPAIFETSEKGAE